MNKKPDVLSELDKVIEGWEYIVGHDKGKLSKTLTEQIIKTIQLLHGYKQARTEVARELFEEIEYYRSYEVRKGQAVLVVTILEGEWQSFKDKFLKEAA